MHLRRRVPPEYKLLFQQLRQSKPIARQIKPTSVLSAPVASADLNPAFLSRAALYPLILLFIISIFAQHVTASTTPSTSRSVRLSDFDGSPDAVDSLALSSSSVNEPTAGDNVLKLKKRQSSSPATSFPTPFDGGLGSNFTSPSCPLFFNTFLNDATFQSCHAISLLLVTSQGFFQASRYADTMNGLLDLSCNADVQSCKSVMSNFVKTLKSQGGCATDFQAQNPNVMEAYQGFLAYEAVYNATCLKSARSNDYCFTDAVTNASSPTSSWVYYLPLGIALPATAQPTCNQCLSTTVNNYANFAGNGSLPLSSVYSGAVQQIDLNCGPKFVTATPPKVVGSADHLRTSSLYVWLSVLVTAAILSAS